jgi:hypothetical protein
LFVELATANAKPDVIEKNYNHSAWFPMYFVY